MFDLAQPRAFSPTPWLLCLDLQREHVVPGQRRYAPANVEVAAVCRRVLEQARTRGWRIAHSQLRRPEAPASALEMFGAPIEGLRPLISEPVFFRWGLSAFANPAFAAELREARGAEIYLIGFSLVDTCLATALAGVDEGLSLTIVEDAVGAGPDAAAAAAARALLAPFVRMTPSRVLQTPRLELVV